MKCEKIGRTKHYFNESIWRHSEKSNTAAPKAIRIIAAKTQLFQEVLTEEILKAASAVLLI